MKFSFRHLGSYAALSILWVLHWLPLPMLRALGWLIGHLLFALAKERRNVVLTNLRLCFPEKSSAKRFHLGRRHVVAFTQAFLDRSILWWAPRARLEKLITVNGLEHLDQDKTQPTILLSAHFLGLDAGWTYLSFGRQMLGYYSNQKNPVFDAVLLAGRQRFGNPLLIPRTENVRKVVKCVHDGLPLYYFPDQDYGPRDALFIPFFGVPAATISGLSRMAKLTKARVVPCITRMTPSGYQLEIHPAWENFPSDNVELDTLRQNQFIENQALTMPEQYFWLHKRFKTRPPGEPRIY
jgi:Kdo2-lipid IVA lauroyltransferase/acyltransferase